MRFVADVQVGWLFGNVESRSNDIASLPYLSRAVPWSASALWSSLLTHTVQFHTYVWLCSICKWDQYITHSYAAYHKF